MKINLTNGERLILINQYLILEKLYPEEATYYSRNREILENGYTLHYSDLSEGITEEMSEQQQREILDILSMYRVLYFSVKERANKEQFKNKKIYFPGFDGNSEVSQLGYVLWFIFKLDRFDELKKEESYDSYNTHSETLPTYRKMLEYWNGLSDKNKLSDKELTWLLEHSVSGTLR